MNRLRTNTIDIKIDNNLLAVILITNKWILILYLVYTSDRELSSRYLTKNAQFFGIQCIFELISVIYSFYWIMFSSFPYFSHFSKLIKTWKTDALNPVVNSGIYWIVLFLYAHYNTTEAYITPTFSIGIPLLTNHSLTEWGIHSIHWNLYISFSLCFSFKANPFSLIQNSLTLG